MCCICVGYKKYDLKTKTTEAGRAEQNKKQRLFAFRKKLGFVLWGFTSSDFSCNLFGFSVLPLALIIDFEELCKSR